MAVALHSENIEIQEEDDDEEEDDDINYANVETKTTAQQKHPRKIRPVRRRYRLVGLGLGLLCGVQALLNIGLRLSFYSELMKENNNLVKDLDQLQYRYNNVTEQYNKRILCEPHGFTFGGGVCYYYMPTWVATWEKSRKYCRDKQSDLMVINSKDKQDFVNTVVNRDHNMWLGLTDREEEGVWKWVDGTPLTTPTYWGPDEPNNSGDQDCVVLHAGRWNDRSCSAHRYLICERVI